MCLPFLIHVLHVTDPQVVPSVCVWVAESYSGEWRIVSCYSLNILDSRLGILILQWVLWKVPQGPQPSGLCVCVFLFLFFFFEGEEVIFSYAS